MAAIDFNKALDVKAADVKAVPVPPIGHYVWQVSAIPTINTEGRWQAVRFPVKAVKTFEDADDVDADELKEYGKVTSITNSVAFMFDSEEGTETDMIQFQNRVKRFCADHLLIEGADEMSLRELLTKSVNKQFVGQLVHKQDKRDTTGETMQANIARTAPLEV